MGKKSKAERLREEQIVIESLERIMNPPKPRLANPAFGTHAVVMYVLDRREDFLTWVNECTNVYEDDPPKSLEDIDKFLHALHDMVHAAMLESLIELPIGTRVKLVSMPRHMRPTD